MINIDNKKMARVVSSFQVPVKPQILIDMQLLLAEEEPNIKSIVGLISNDVGLSSSILKIINSPLYGVNRRVSKIKQAVVILGLKTINSLVTALLLKSSIRGNSCISLERFWDDSVDVANAMIFIGNKLQNKIPVDMLYTIGLFKNCGIPLLAIKFCDYKDLLIEANGLGVNSIKLEDKKYKTNHAAIGYYVASSWHLPKEICSLILQQHESDYLSQISGTNEQLTFAMLKVAEHMVERVKRFNASPDWESIKDGVLNVLGLTYFDFEELEDDYIELLG